MLRASSLRRGLVAAAFGSLITALVPTARAAGGDEAAAEALFVEAKKLASQKRYADACPKFAESNRLDRGAGTMIHLGDCYEHNHQLASAWATYKEAASAAQALGRRDWEKLAAQRANALEPKLARLTVRVDGPTEKLVVTRDGSEVASAAWGVPIPVDSGDHAVVATAVGHKPYRTTARVQKDGQNVEIVIPRLEDEPAPVAPPTPIAAPVVAPPRPAPAAAVASTPPAPPVRGSAQRTVGFVIAGVGVAGLGAGAVTGLMAIGKKNDAKAVCPEDGACGSRAAVDAADSARKLGTVSTIGFAAGGALVAAGAVLVLTAPKQERAPRTGLSLVPQASPNGGGLDLLGAF